MVFLRQSVEKNKRIDAMKSIRAWVIEDRIKKSSSQVNYK